LGAFVAVVVVDVFSGGVAVGATGGRRHSGGRIAAADRLRVFAGTKTVFFDQVFPVGGRFPELGSWSGGERRLRIDIELSVVGMFETEGILAFDVGPIPVEDF